jgi:hypothetical protein
VRVLLAWGSDTLVELGRWSCPGFDDTWTLPVVGRRK